MSTDLDIRQEISDFIESTAPVTRILPQLREYRSRDVSRSAVLTILEDLRDAASSEATEDRVLEVMDLVAGFCRVEDAVWDSHAEH